MNDVQQTIAGLRVQGWTLAALAEEMGVFRTALDKWVAGQRYPRNARAVLALLQGLDVAERGAPEAPVPVPGPATASEPARTPEPPRAPVEPVSPSRGLRRDFAELQRMLDDDWRQIQAS